MFKVKILNIKLKASSKVNKFIKIEALNNNQSNKKARTQFKYKGNQKECQEQAKSREVHKINVSLLNVNKKYNSKILK